MDLSLHIIGPFSLSSAEKFSTFKSHLHVICSANTAPHGALNLGNFCSSKVFYSLQWAISQQLQSRLKYLTNLWMDSHETWHRHSWFQLKNPSNFSSSSISTLTFSDLIEIHWFLFNKFSLYLVQCWCSPQVELWIVLERIRSDSSSWNKFPPWMGGLILRDRWGVRTFGGSLEQSHSPFVSKGTKLFVASTTTQQENTVREPWRRIFVLKRIELVNIST